MVPGQQRRQKPPNQDARWRANICMPLPITGQDSRTLVTFKGRALESAQDNMAARHQGTRKTRRLKRKKPQKKRQQARKKQRRLKSRKQKRRQALRMGSRTVLSISSPRLFAAKILRQMPKVRMESKARGLVKTLLMDVYDNMSKEMESLSQSNQEPTVASSDMQAVLKEAMVKGLAKHTAEPATSETATAA